MPNLVNNQMTIKGPKARLLEIREAVQGNQKIDGGEIKPFDFFKIKEDGEFGVKWNACDPTTNDDLDDTDHEDDLYELNYAFETAWNWPEPVLDAFCTKYPDVEMEYKCYGGDFLVHGWNENGELHYNMVDDSEIFHEDNKWEYIDFYFDENSDLDRDDYNLDDFFEEVSEITWVIHEEGFSFNNTVDEENGLGRFDDDFECLSIKPDDEDEFEQILNKYKK